MFNLAKMAAGVVAPRNPAGGGAGDGRDEADGSGSEYSTDHEDEAVAAVAAPQPEPHYQQPQHTTTATAPDPVVAQPPAVVAPAAAAADNGAAAQYQREAEQLRVQLRQAGRDKQALEEAVGILEHDVDAARREHRSLEQQLATTQAQLRDSTQQLQQQAQQQSGDAQIVAQYQQQLADSQAQLQAARSECDQLRQQSGQFSEERHALTQQLAAAQARVGELEAQLQRDAPPGATTTRSHPPTTAATTTGSHPPTTAATTTGSHPPTTAATTTRSDAAAELEKQLEDVRAELRQVELSRDAARRMSSSNHAKLAAAEKRIAELEGGATPSSSRPLTPSAPPAAPQQDDAALAEARSQIDTLQRQLSQVEQGAAAAKQAFEADAEKLRRERDELKAAAERHAAASASGASASSAAEARAAAAEQKLATVRAQFDEAQQAAAANEGLRDEAARLRTELAAASDQCSQAADSARLWKQHADGLQASLDELKQQQQQLQQSQEAKTGDEEGAREELAQLREELVAKSAKLTQVTQHVAKVSQEARDAVADLEAKSDVLRDRERRLAETQELLAEANASLDELRRRDESDASTRKHTVDAAEAAASTISELQQELATARESQHGALETCVKALATHGVVLPQNERDRLQWCVGELAMLLRDSDSALAETKHALAQWEGTYVQARDVNNALKQQLDGLKAELKQVKDDAAVKQASLDRASGNAQDQAARFSGLQADNDRLVEEAATASRREQELQERLSRANAALEEQKTREGNADQQLISLRQQQDMHDTELAEARESVENMERVLAAFQAQKQADLDEKTQFLTYEVDDVKRQLLQQKSLVATARAEAESQVKAIRREVATKNNTINSLQAKLGDLRQALEQTMSKINDANTIDKRVVSHLLVNYVSSVRERRGDDMDIIRVMAGLLNWDGDEMKRVGLVDPDAGEQGAADNGPGGSVVLGWGRSLLGGVGGRLGIKGTPGRPQRPAAGGGAAAPSSANLAQAWVEFLLKEADTAGSAAARGSSAAEGTDRSIAGDEAAAASGPGAATATPPLGNSRSTTPTAGM